MLQIRAGADYVLTQATFDNKILIRFLQKCTEAKINVPIFFGFFLFDNFKDLIKFTSFCHLKLPIEIYQIAYNNRNNREAIKNFSIFHHKNLIKTIYEQQYPYSRIHFFTLNNLFIVNEFTKQLHYNRIERPLRVKF